ncbi:unnamed protein product [Prorocentrum cordatum]|uniref:Uncharacterized protein n=1 Tax=Prorocentrum cordatum TaxID=2364126 RepID=A0ABN9RJS9_9DINO|nr:unnamed protein product [Polarella glacialis]
MRAAITAAANQPKRSTRPIHTDAESAWKVDYGDDSDDEETFFNSEKKGYRTQATMGAFVEETATTTTTRQRTTTRGSGRRSAGTTTGASSRRSGPGRTPPVSTLAPTPRRVLSASPPPHPPCFILLPVSPSDVVTGRGDAPRVLLDVFHSGPAQRSVSLVGSPAGATAALERGRRLSLAKGRPRGGGGGGGGAAAGASPAVAERRLLRAWGGASPTD